jgi:hypothetical protein
MPKPTQQPTGLKEGGCVILIIGAGTDLHITSQFRLFAKPFLAVTPHFSIYCHFFSLCLLPFLVPLSVLFVRKFCLPESLFLDENSNQSLFLHEN